MMLILILIIKWKWKFINAFQLSHYNLFPFSETSELNVQYTAFFIYFKFEISDKHTFKRSSKNIYLRIVFGSFYVVHFINSHKHEVEIIFLFSSLSSSGILIPF